MRALQVTAITVLTVLASQPGFAQQMAFRDEKLSLETRALHIVRRLTLEEKVLQMKDVEQALERLGIRSFTGTPIRTPG